MTGKISHIQAEGNRDHIEKLANAFAISNQQARDVIDRVTPEFTHALEELTLSRGGLADLLEAAGRHLHARERSNPTDLNDPIIRTEGDHLLAQMFKSKYKSRVLANRVGRRTGLDPDLVKRMLPVLAYLYMDRIGEQTREPLERVSKSVHPDERFSGHEPLAVPDRIPQGRGADPSRPYGDLTDILRRGTRPQGGAPGGGYLWQIVRNILAPLLGFQSKGIFGWIMRLIVYRYGWTIVKFLFRALFLRR